MARAMEAFCLHLIDHWIWLMGLLLMTEPLLDYYFEGFRVAADRVLPRKSRTRLAITLSVGAVVVACFLAFKDEYAARDADDKAINGTITSPGYRQRLEMAEGSVKALDESINGHGGYKDQIAGLNKQLGKTSDDLTFLQRQKPQVVVQTKEVPVVIPSGAVQMTDEQKNRVKSIRVGLSAFLVEGERIADTMQDGTTAQDEKKADEWLMRTIVFVKNNLDDSYVTRLNDYSDVPSVSRNGLEAAAQPLWFGIHVRVVRLNQFITELSR